MVWSNGASIVRSTDDHGFETIIIKKKKNIYWNYLYLLLCSWDGECEWPLETIVLSLSLLLFVNSFGSGSESWTFDVVIGANFNVAVNIKSKSFISFSLERKEI